MAGTKTMKTSDRQALIKKLTTELKKHYKGQVPKQTQPVLETMMFATCLEDSSYADAETAHQAMLDSFFDLNEIRVSSVTEISESLGDLYESEWKAHRIRETLQHTFEKHYAFDLEGVKRKTQDAALKELAEIPTQSPFVRAYVIQHCLGAHVLPLDHSMVQALKWLGLVSPDADSESAADELKSAIKKSDGPEFCFRLKCLATDERVAGAFADSSAADDDGAFDPTTGTKRLAELIKTGWKPPKKKKTKSAASATVSKKKPAKKKSARSSRPTGSTSVKVAKKKPAKAKSKRKTKRS